MTDEPNEVVNIDDLKGGSLEYWIHVMSSCCIKWRRYDPMPPISKPRPIRRGVGPSQPVAKPGEF